MFANGFGEDLNNCLRLLSSFTCLVNDRFQVAIWLADPILSAHVDIILCVQENAALNCTNPSRLWNGLRAGKIGLASIYSLSIYVTASWLATDSLHLLPPILRELFGIQFKTIPILGLFLKKRKNERTKEPESRVPYGDSAWIAQ